MSGKNDEVALISVGVYGPTALPVYVKMETRKALGTSIEGKPQVGMTFSVVSQNGEPITIDDLRETQPEHLSILEKLRRVFSPKNIDLYDVLSLCRAKATHIVEAFFPSNTVESAFGSGSCHFDENGRVEIRFSIIGWQSPG